MKTTNWRKMGPQLIFLVGTLAAVLVRGREDPELSLNLFLFLCIPIVLVGLSAAWVIEKGSQAKSARTWRVMEQRHPDEIKYLFHVLPETRRDLNRLGLHPRPDGVTSPVIGVVFGPDVTFWEEGNVGWSLRVAYSNIESVELASTESGVKSWPAIRLLSIDCGTVAVQEHAAIPAPRRGDLVLSIRHLGHKQLRQAERTDLVCELNSRLAQA